MENEKKNPAVWEDDEKTFLLPTPSLAAASPPSAPAEEPQPAPAEKQPEAKTEVVFPFLQARGASEASSQTGTEPAAEREPRPASPIVLSGPSAPAPAPKEEPFDRPGTTRVGLLGGKGVGKSYLFQAMVYRTLDSRRSGALSYYIDRDAVRVYEARDRNSTPRSLIPSEFIEDYKSWMRLFPTILMDQRWYRLRLQFRTGLLGSRKSFLDLDFLDGSGESFEMGISADTEEIWKSAFLDARVMVFCLPLWVAFPAAGGVLSEDDWKYREQVIRGFDSVVRHYKDLREKYQVSHPVRSILAMTMADDRRSALATLRDRWIHPFVEQPMIHLDEMRSASGVARYVLNARKISEAIWKEFESVSDPLISSIPLSIEFGAGRPWFIPVSAIDGAILDAQRHGSGAQASRRPPVPVHVELPLLVALSESHNALM